MTSYHKPIPIGYSVIHNANGSRNGEYVYNLLDSNGVCVGASISIIKFNGLAWYLRNIEVLQSHRSMGCGTLLLLETLKNQASINPLPVTLEIPIDYKNGNVQKKADYDRLYNWYCKYGFQGPKGAILHKL